MNHRLTSQTGCKVHICHFLSFFALMSHLGVPGTPRRREEYRRHSNGTISVTDSRYPKIDEFETPASSINIFLWILADLLLSF